MQYDNDEKSRPSYYFLALVAFIALFSGAGIAIIGFVIGTHASTPILQNPDGTYAAPASSTACAQGPQTFSYTGSQQAVSVPSDCTAAIIEAVGAGGGGFADSQQTGGNGGYAAAQIKLSGISQLIVIVGQGGVGTCSGDCSGDDDVLPAFGGGAGTQYGNGGGGYSGVFDGVVEQSAALVVAGGGGGGGGGSGGTGGNGGGLFGQLGSNPGSGGGGTQTAGGPAAPGRDGYNSNAPGQALTGGTGYYGGGGGGGYFGGGGGSREGFWVHVGGGGGSGYIYPKAIGTGINLAGSQLGLSKDADAAWKSGIGIGGQNGNGSNGSVTIIWEKEKSWYNIF